MKQLGKNELKPFQIAQLIPVIPIKDMCFEK